MALVVMAPVLMAKVRPARVSLSGGLGRGEKPRAPGRHRREGRGEGTSRRCREQTSCASPSKGYPSFRLRAATGLSRLGFSRSILACPLCRVEGPPRLREDTHDYVAHCRTSMAIDGSNFDLDRQEPG